MGDFEVVRRRTVAAPADRVHALINDFHEWRRWSPWEDVDPQLRRDYSGADRGVGARYAWEGNRKAGKGDMEITGSTPERVDVRLTFAKPMKATNRIAFELRPAGPERTDVAWRMTGTTKGVMALFGKVVSMDRLVGRDFEKGLERLDVAAAEPQPAGGSTSSASS
jgi:hypothetical protein